MDDFYVYRLRVPAAKSDDLIVALMKLGLIDEEDLRVLHAPDGSGEDDE